MRQHARIGRHHDRSQAISTARIEKDDAHADGHRSRAMHRYATPFSTRPSWEAGMELGVLYVSFFLLFFLCRTFLCLSFAFFFLSGGSCYFISCAEGRAIFFHAFIMRLCGGEGLRFIVPRAIF
jgi:hypothetical protein